MLKNSSHLRPKIASVVDASVVQPTTRQQFPMATPPFGERHSDVQYAYASRAQCRRPKTLGASLIPLVQCFYIDGSVRSLHTTLRRPAKE